MPGHDGVETHAPHARPSRVKRIASQFVMPGFMPGIHVFQTFKVKDVDGRDKPGHDDF